MMHNCVWGKIALPNVKLLSSIEAGQVNAEGLKNIILKLVSELRVVVNGKHTDLMGNSIHSL